jgi:hypothetical protein
MRKQFTTNFKSVEFRKQLKKQFEKFNLEHSVLIENKLAEQRETGKTPEGIFTFTETTPDLFSAVETEFGKNQKTIRQLDRMENKPTAAYKFEDVDGNIITVSAPLRLVEQVQEAAKEKLGDKYISIVKTK